jgi:hypothetical protein
MAINDYVTYEEVTEHLVEVPLDESYQELFEQLITRASRLIDGLLKREPGAFYVSADTTRYFSGSGDERLWIGEMAAAPTTVSVAETGILTTYTAWAATDYICWPYNALLEGMPYLRLDIDSLNGTKSCWYSYPKSVKVIGKFGFSAAVPDEIKEACIVQIVRWFKRGQQAFQDAGAVMELGQLRYVRKLDPEVETMLSIPKFHRLTI